MVGIFIELVNLFKQPWITNNLNDGKLDWYFLMIGIFTFIIFLIFVKISLNYKYKHLKNDDNGSSREMDKISSDLDSILDIEPYQSPVDVVDRHNSFA